MRYLGLLLLVPSLCFAGDWSREDSYRQVALTTLLIVDWAQTRDPRFPEGNSILGPHPSNGRINNYFALAIFGHAVISTALPPSPRALWQYLWIGIEANSVYHNHSIGVKMTF